MLQAVESSYTASASACANILASFGGSRVINSSSFSMSSGDVWCPEHSQWNCMWHTWSGDSTWVPPPYDLTGVGTGINPSVIPWVNPAPNSFVFEPLPECALCDKPLELGERKVCKECRGVFEAWKFLSKPSKDEKEPGEGEDSDSR